MNLYEYVRSNPLIGVDPSGLGYSPEHLIARKGERLLIKAIQSNPSYVILQGIGKAASANGPDLIVYNKATEVFEFFDNKAWARKTVNRVPQWMVNFNFEEYRAVLCSAINSGIVPADVAKGYEAALNAARYRRIVTPFGGKVQRIGKEVAQHGIEFMDQQAVKALGRGAGSAGRKALCALPIAGAAIEILSNPSVADAAEIPTPEQIFVDIVRTTLTKIRSGTDSQGFWRFTREDLLALHEDFSNRGYLVRKTSGWLFPQEQIVWSDALTEEDLDYINDHIRMDELIDYVGLGAAIDGQAVLIGGE